MRYAFFVPILQHCNLYVQDHFYLDYVICEYNPTYLANGTCKLNFITRMQKSLTAISVAVKTLENVIARFKLYYKFTSGYKPLLIDVTTNACDFTSGKVKSKMMDYVMPALIRYSNTNFKCPFFGPVIVKNMPINMGIFDYVFIPAGNYMLNITLTVKDELVWRGKFYFILPEGKTADDDRMG